MSEFSGLSAYQLPSAEIDRLLAQGEGEEQLKAYFGQADYAELRDLVRRASTRVRAPGPKVLVLPGILGSTLGIRKSLRNDTIWLDPISIVAGDAAKLALGGTSKIEALDVLPLIYTKLKWRLWWYGFDAEYYCYDWRKGVDELGKELKQYCDKLGSVQIVAHSMGGLVARAAVAAGATSIDRVVMLGTPNAGAFVPVQVFRATATTLRQVAALDLQHTAEQLVSDVFSTFPSFYHMLPFADHYQAVNFYTQGTWPKDNLRPKRGLLTKAVEVQRALADPTLPVFKMIAAYDQPTIVGVQRREQDGKVEFLYEQGRGDGTVPLDLAALPGMDTYYVTGTHNGITGDVRVGEAVRDLLRTGSTTVLRVVSEADLVKEPVFGGRVGNAITEPEKRVMLESLMALSPTDTKPAAPSGSPTANVSAPVLPRFDGVVVGRRRMHRLDLELVNGSITDVDAKAAVLGVFQNVRPAGPAEAFNKLLGRAIDEFVSRRMFNAGLGEVFMLPTGTHPVRAETVLFAGLGPFDAFTGDAQQVVAGNVLRTLVHAGVEEFATVLFGGNSAEQSSITLENLLRGFVSVLVEADTRHRFRRIVLCELDTDRFIAMKQRLYELASTSLFDHVELTIDELPPVAAPAPPPPVVAREVSPIWPQGNPLYLTVRWQSLEEEQPGQVALRSSLLTAGHKATVISTLKQFDVAELKQLLTGLPDVPSSKAAKLGRDVAHVVLDPNMLALLGREEFRKAHLVLAHDADSSRIPWELLNFGSEKEPWFPAVEGGITRKYMAENMSIAKWLEQRRLSTSLHVLLVVNPTMDLVGAEKEGKEVLKTLSELPTVRVTTRLGPQAQRETLLKDFRSGKYDVVHYAGHAYFNVRQPALSGIKCAGGEILSGTDLRDVGNLPALVFFNACESARVRSDSQPPTDADEQARQAAGFAEAFLRGGVANFIGTYWNVGDAPALLLATEFYKRVIDGKTIGESLLEARRHVKEATRSKDWADYMSYGDPSFVLKQRAL